MFTGIIEEMGELRKIERAGQAMVLTIGAAKILEDMRLGDSIAVNGVCLTVIRFDSSSFSVDVMPETYRKTNLHELQSGSLVNLERAMAANGRFGGHIVQGHVDGTAVIIRRKREDNAVMFTLRLHDTGLSGHIVERGSITIDGISLTVIRAEDDGEVAVSIIPHTLEQTVLKHKREGMTVNIETDIVGKYIEHLLSRRTATAADRASSTSGARGSNSGLTMAMLTDNGFV